MSKKDKNDKAPAPVADAPAPIPAEPVADAPAEPVADAPAEPVAQKSNLPDGYETSEAARLRLLRDKEARKSA